MIGRTLLLAAASLVSLGAGAADYTIVVSSATDADPAWSKVVQSLVRQHAGSVIHFTNEVAQSLESLRAAKPRAVCFVAQPQEASLAFVVQVHRLTRKLDADPYPDCRWGILTGLDASDALRIAETPGPLVIRRVAGGTEFALEPVSEAVWFDEMKAGHVVKKSADGKLQETKGTNDTTADIVSTLSNWKPELFITSGHATQRGWQIGYGFEGGFLLSTNGHLVAKDPTGKFTEVWSGHPKVYLPVGNCLMGHIDGPDAMALAWMHSAGVRQMTGYVMDTWYGYAGWGVMDYFVEQPGRFSLAEAFQANNIALIDRLVRFFPKLAALESPEDADMKNAELTRLGPAAQAEGLATKDGFGLLYDRDFQAFYGDPAWDARLAPGPCRWKQALRREGDEFVFEVHPLRAAETFAPVSTNGSQRGGRPVIQFFTDRIGKATVTAGAEWNPVITDDFILVPAPKPKDPVRDIVIRFKAAKAP
ncbi:MAG: hypothetical protein IT581_18585 [Verrucomicrobiales bacterium]|nr:hypothetical protein [Verrucomicrobiales bacterium]